MTDAQGNQLTYRQIAERMTLRPWDGKQHPPVDAAPAATVPTEVHVSQADMIEEPATALTDRLAPVILDQFVERLKVEMSW
jgi:hypothetical protein